MLDHCAFACACRRKEYYVRSVWCLGGIHPLRDQSMLLVRSNVLPAERPAKITTYSSMNSLSIAESNKDFGMMGEVISWQSRSQNSKACSQTARVEAEIKRKDGTCAARISKALRVPPESAFHWPAEWWETFSVFTLAGTSRERFTLTTFTFRLFFTPV